MNKSPTKYPLASITDSTINGKTSGRSNNIHYKICGECGNEVQEAHTWEKLSGTGNYKSQTCTADGYQKYRCKVCGAIYTETLKALGHSFTDLNGAVTQYTSCTANGVRYYTCSRCHTQGTNTGTYEYAWGHDMQWTHDNGSHWRDCSRCDYTDNWGGHSWDWTEFNGCRGPENNWTQDAHCNTCGARWDTGVACTGKHQYYLQGHLYNTSSSSMIAGDFKCSLCGRTNTFYFEPGKGQSYLEAAS